MSVRIQEILQSEYDHTVSYSTLTRIVRDLDLREDKKKRRSGTYQFGPGQEMQHDTSPHQVVMGDKTVKAQCTGLVLGYSRKLFIQYYPCFTRFEARVFLDEAFRFMEGTCPRCIIDNTSVIVAHGSGPDAEIAPEIERFGQIFSVKFVPHALATQTEKQKWRETLTMQNRTFLRAAPSRIGLTSTSRPNDGRRKWQTKR